MEKVGLTLFFIDTLFIFLALRKILSLHVPRLSLYSGKFCEGAYHYIDISWGITDVADRTI